MLSLNVLVNFLGIYTSADDCQLGSRVLQPYQILKGADIKLQFCYSSLLKPNLSH